MLPFAAVVTVLFFGVPSFDSIYISITAVPPFALRTHAIVSKSTPAVAVGVFGACGTVVAVAAGAATAFEELSK